MSLPARKEKKKKKAAPGTGIKVFFSQVDIYFPLPRAIATPTGHKVSCL